MLFSLLGELECTLDRTPDYFRAALLRLADRHLDALVQPIDSSVPLLQQREAHKYLVHLLSGFCKTGLSWGNLTPSIQW